MHPAVLYFVLFCLSCQLLNQRIPDPKTNQSSMNHVHYWWNVLHTINTFSTHRHFGQYIVPQNNTEIHTAHTIVSCPSPKPWVIVHTSDSMMKIWQCIYILSIITREMSRLKTHSPTCFVMDNWENMLYLTHTLDQLYLTGIFWVQCLQISLHNDDNDMV